MVHLNVHDPDLQALTLTVGHAAELLRDRADTPAWDALTQVLVDQHTPEQLASMLTGAAALIARTQTRPIL